MPHSAGCWTKKSARSKLDSNKYSTQVEWLGVVETGRRRRWTDDEKLKIVLESMQTPRAISSTARRYGISRSLLLNWRQIVLYGAGRRCGAEIWLCAGDGRGGSDAVNPFYADDRLLPVPAGSASTCPPPPRSQHAWLSAFPPAPPTWDRAAVRRDR